ncbi:MAG: phosphoketolase, partial [Deltaproteobacteria bacterium]
HLNGYKIAGPTVLGRLGDPQLRQLLTGHGYAPIFVSGDQQEAVHRALAEALEASFAAIRAIQRRARSGGGAPATAPAWPLLVLRTPKGWTGPREVDGVRIEGTNRAHQVPLAGVRDNPAHLQQLESWLKSYRPEQLFDAAGAPVALVCAGVPRGARRMGCSPHANGGRLLQPLRLPPTRAYAYEVSQPGAQLQCSTDLLGQLLRDVYRDNPHTFRLFCPDETQSNRLGAVFAEQARCLMTEPQAEDQQVGPAGRVMEVLSEHNCEGWLEGYLLTGRHGMFASYEAFAMIVVSMVVQHAKWLDACNELPWRRPIASLNVLLSSTCWRNDHNGFSHQGPGFMDMMLSRK